MFLDVILSLWFGCSLASSEQETRLRLCGFCKSSDVCGMIVWSFVRNTFLFFLLFTCSVKYPGGPVVIILLCPVSQLPSSTRQMSLWCFHCVCITGLSPEWALHFDHWSKGEFLPYYSSVLELLEFEHDLVVWIELVIVFNFTKVIKYLFSLALLTLLPLGFYFVSSPLWTLVGFVSYKNQNLNHAVGERNTMHDRNQRLERPLEYLNYFKY